MVGDIVSEEIRRRIKVSVWAYAYEFLDKSLVSDEKFDEECYRINPDLVTGNELLDTWFKTEFAPYTGSWIRNHPELDKIAELYGKFYSSPSAAQPRYTPENNPND